MKDKANLVRFMTALCTTSHDHGPSHKKGERASQLSY
jgi:hypothetical protein